MKTLWVSAGLKTCEGKSSVQALAQLTLLQVETVKEEGCIRFDVLQHQDSPGLFTLWEEWLDEGDLVKHMAASYTQEYLAMNLTQVTYFEKLVRINDC